MHVGEGVFTPAQMAALGPGGGPITIVLQLDGTELARVTAAPMQSEQNRLVRLGAV